MIGSAAARVRTTIAPIFLLGIALLLSGADTAFTVAACDNVWRSVPAPGSRPLLDVAAIGPGQLWVVGEAGFAAHGRPGHWTIDPLPAASSARRVAGVKGFKWAIGQGESGDRVVLHWVEGRWRIARTFAADSAYFDSIAVNSDHEVWLSGHAVAQDGSLRPLVVWLDGSGWHRRTLAAAGWARGVASLNSSRTVLVGTVDVGEGEYRNVSWWWNGVTWTRQRLFTLDDEAYGPQAVVVDLAHNGEAFAASIFSDGDCCHSSILVSRHVQGVWRTETIVVGSPFDIVAGWTGRNAVLVGDEFHGDGGGGYYAGIIHTRHGSTWTRHDIFDLTGIGTDSNIYGLDADSTGGRWLVGAGPGRTALLATQCRR